MNKQANGKGGRGIEWTDYTWNPIAGCKHGCSWLMPDGKWANCYAEDVANKTAAAAYPQGFEHHYWKPNLLEEPLKLKTSSKIFVGSMADVFGHWVPAEQIQQVLDVCARAHWHTFQFLTKNPIRLAKFNFPANCWVGISSPPDRMWGNLLHLEQQTKLLMSSLNALDRCNARVKWMSIEPLCWDIAYHLRWDDQYGANHHAKLDWAVIGAASNGPVKYQPEPAWVSNAVATLTYLIGAKVFFKGNLRGNPAATPWREEFPA